MNFIGKSFVLIFSAASIFCLVTAMAVYTQRMDFVTPKGETSKKAMTRLDESIAHTKELIKTNNRAYTRWLQEYEEVVKLEVVQYQRREFYRGQIELVKTGKFEGLPKDDAVQVLPDHDPATGLLAIDQPVGRKPVQARMMGENVKPQSAYIELLKNSYKDYLSFQQSDEEILKKIRMTTDAINGTAEPFVKGLRTRIDEQVQIAADADAETLYLEDFVTNRRADAQLFVKRRDALNASIARLKRFEARKLGGQGN